MRCTYRTLNDYEMQHNAEVVLFTKPSNLERKMFVMDRCKHGLLKEQCSICMRENVKHSLQGARTITGKAKQVKHP